MAQRASSSKMTGRDSLPELLDRVFEPFFRADRARRQDVRGAGLGLTIAREIVQRAGGRIDIANRDAGGLRQIVEGRGPRNCPTDASRQLAFFFFFFVLPRSMTKALSPQSFWSATISVGSA